MSSKVKSKKSSNKPMEVSATRPVGRFRQVVEDSRDPRFDNLSGKFNEDLFKKSYDFLKGYKENEIEALKNKAKKTKDLTVKESLNRELGVELTKMATEQQKEKQLELKRKIKKEEKELIKQGKKPFYLKKNALRQIELTEKFNQMKDKKNFDKVLEKRRKRNATKEHKMLPYKRRHD